MSVVHAVDDDPVYSQYREVCLDMNMDSQTMLSAWNSYVQVRQHYSLEGDRLHWLACALYVASRNGQVPSVTPHCAPVQGNFISLTRLLRSCRLSLLEFFDKSVKWADMSNMPVALRRRLDTLQRSFAVTMFLFNNYYEPIFRRLFGDRSSDTPRAAKPRKQHRGRPAPPCNRADLFHFTWTLFVLVKWQTAAVTCDLVSTYHLLLACVDFVFGAALVDGRSDLIRADSGAVPANWAGPNCPSGTGSTLDSVSILEFLCRNFDGLIVEVKGVRQHSLRERLTALYGEGVLHGCPPNTPNRLGRGLLADSDAFHASCKSMNKRYEEYLLTCGNFDERAFLGESALEQIGLPSRTNNFSVTAGDLAHRIMLRRSLMLEHADPEPLVPATPLTGRGYLRASSTVSSGSDSSEQKPRPEDSGGGGTAAGEGGARSSTENDSVNGGLVYMSMQSVSRLQQLLAGRQQRPSPALQQLLTEAAAASKKTTSSSASAASTESSSRPSTADELCTWLSALVDDLGKQFVAACSEQLGGNADAHQLAVRRFQMATTLYYRQLENIVVAEKMRRPNIDLMVLLCQPIFHRCLLSCSLEMVLFSYNTGSLEFPWLLDALAIEPYDFYKLLEIVIREEHGLCRDIIKHLSKVEEQILDSMAWRTSSRLWHVIDAVQGRVPSSETVALPPSSSVAPSKLAGSLPSEQLATASISTPLRGIRRLCMERPAPTLPHQSPLSSMASERFMSPVSSTARRRLFAVTTSSTSTPSATISIASASNGATTRGALAVTKAGHKRVLTFGADENSPLLVNRNRCDGGAESVPVPSATATPGSQPSTTATATKTKQNSLGLFFRKFYHLAWVRLRELSGRLDLNGDTRQTVWTVLEYVVVNHVDIMMGRHLDQLIMCSVFVVCKAFGVGKKFTDIMGHYRYQPQARSHVYRSVLLGVRPAASGEIPAVPAVQQQAESTGENGSTSPVAAVSETAVVNGGSSVVSTPGSVSVAARASVCPPTPSQLAGSATSYRYADRDEIRGDIIQFYNQVFVLRVKVFLGKFTKPGDERPPPLSPLPSPRHCSPLPATRRVCSSVYVSPMKAPAPAVAAGWASDRSAVRSYSFCRSPTNDLRLINAMLNTPPPQHQPSPLQPLPTAASTVVRLTPRELVHSSSASSAAAALLSPRVLHVLSSSSTVAAAGGGHVMVSRDSRVRQAGSTPAVNGKPQEKFRARLKRVMDHRQTNVRE